MSHERRWIVLKFGGTSVATKENWQRILQVVQARRDEGFSVCVVHSALKGVSNQLQNLASMLNKEAADETIREIKNQHHQLAADLNLDEAALLEAYYTELEHLSHGIVLIGEASHRVQARLLALGELMATTLGSAYLNEHGIPVTWLDARQIIESIPQKNVSEESAILGAVASDEEDTALQERVATMEQVVLTQGFIARDRDKQTVLFGRGGSDVSAAYFAAKLGGKRLEIWTDVPGLFSANPSLIPSARLLTELSYEEAQEIATNGAYVLHPKCILPAQKHHIPIHVRCTQRPELRGTVISDKTAEGEGHVKTIALRSDIVLISMESLGMWQQVGFLADAFEVFKAFGLSIDLISTSQSNITVSLDPAFNTHFQSVREDFVQELKQQCKVHIICNVSAISLLGRDIRTILHQLGEAFQVFQEHRIYLVSQAANDLNFTVVVSSEQANRLVKQLHKQVISQAANSDFLGDTWEGLMGVQSSSRETVTSWWKTKRPQLLDIAREKRSAYVYDSDELQQNIERIQQIKAVDTYFYAMKANANEQVLSHFYEAGLGFECVSIGELKKIFELFPDISTERILFTPNFAPRHEYEYGFEKEVHVTLDNIYPLQQWPEVFEGRAFFLRIDPGYGQGHHKHVKTGGIHSKFGIPRFEIDEVKRMVDKTGGIIKGLHAHTGSGIKDENLWQKTAYMLHEVAQKLGSVEILDLGGGLGIREHETQNTLDLKAVNKSLEAFKKDHPEYELWIEPGRFLTATAGVLLTTVTQLKGKGNVRYVGVETGMNSFIRPALYGSSHTIVNLSRLDDPVIQSVNIVGPICESGDKLGMDRRFPESKEGDVILIANAGAYGQVMSSNYNLREPAEEVFLDA